MFAPLLESDHHKNKITLFKTIATVQYRNDNEKGKTNILSFNFS